MEEIMPPLVKQALTSQAAEFVTSLTWPDLPPDLVDVALDHVLDSYGVMLAGVNSDPARIVRQVFGGRPGTSSVLGTGERWDAISAALANGVAGHALDYDDTQLSTSPEGVYGLLTHPSVPVLAACTAVAEAVSAEGAGASGQDLVTAFVAGVEVACRVSDAINNRHYQAGFHSTGTVGTIGAAAAAGKLLGLNPERLAVAMSIAASMASGLRENFGTMTKPLHSGRAGGNGVAAAYLSRAGFTASDHALEAPRGFFNAAGGGYAPERIDGRLGKPFFLLDPGVSIKPYPSGSLAHPAMDVMLDLVVTHDLRPGEVQRIVVGTNSNVPNALIHHRPSNELQAKFSMEYCIATCVIRRRAGLAEFTDKAVLAPEIQAFIPKVDLVVDPELEALGYQHVRSRVTLYLNEGARTDGTVISGEAEWAHGYPSKPMTPQQLTGKFTECAEQVLPRERAQSAAEAIRELPAASSLAKILAQLA
jgi:2-methylcitrate dehydratase PrpD